MGCSYSKKFVDEDCVKMKKLFDEWIFDEGKIVCEVLCKEVVNNDMGRIFEKKLKKGCVFEGKFSFDLVVIEKYEIKVLIGRGLFS